MPKKKYSKNRPSTKRQSWKQLRRKKRIKRKLRLFGLGLLVFFSGILFYSFLKAWDYFVNPKAQASFNINLEPPISTKGSFALFLAYKEETIKGDWVLTSPKILIINKSFKKATLFTLPSDTNINTKDFGEISLTGFGNLFKGESSLESITCLENALEIPIEGVFFSEPDIIDLTFDKGGLLSINTFYHTKLSDGGNVYTNLSFSQLGDMLLFLRGLMPDDFEELTWDSSFATSRLEKDIFLKESLRLEIVNGSNVAGLANTESSKLTALGIKISSIRNIDSSDKDIAGSNEENALILKSKDFRDLETVDYIVKRYKTKIHYQEDLKYPATLIIINEP